MENLYSDQDTVHSYLADISFSKPISREREAELAARIQAGDQDARDELVEANLFFVIRIVRKYRNCGLPESDLIGAGNWGLLTAAERFDGRKGYKFISYATHWIRQSILSALADQPRVVRLPMNHIDAMQKIARAQKRLQQEKGWEPDAGVIAEDLRMPVEQVKQFLPHENRICSLDRERGTGREKSSFLDVLTDPKQELPDAELERASDKACLRHVLATLDDREQHILRLYYGFGDRGPMTLEQVGQALGLTRERVRQLKVKALKKLMHGSRYRDLKALVNE